MKLARREKYFVLFALCFISVFLLFTLVIGPFFENRDRMQMEVEKKEKQLEEMALLSAEYASLRDDTQRIERVLAKRKTGFTLFSYLENAAGKAQIKDHIEYMKPSTSKGNESYKESLIELRLETLNLKDLISYLYLIEDPENLIMVKRLSVKGNTKEPGYLDAVMQVMTYQ